MQSLMKIALLTVLAFGGSALICAGAHYWSATHREVLTVLEVSSGGDSEAQRIDFNDPWFDWGFIAGRFGAAVVVGLGLSVFYLAAALLRTKTKHEHKLRT